MDNGFFMVAKRIVMTVLKVALVRLVGEVFHEVISRVDQDI